MRSKLILLVSAVVLFAGCSSNGWDAQPIEETEDCVTVTKWESNGWTRTSWNEGVYCKQEVGSDG